VVGCSEYDITDIQDGAAYIKHVTAGRLVIGCNETGGSFELSCQHGLWTGPTANCSDLLTGKCNSRPLQKTINNSPKTIINSTR